MVQDDVGTSFPSIHAAKCAAVRYAGQLLADEAKYFWDDADFELIVTDEGGMILFGMRVVGTEAAAAQSAIRS